ncbi:epoxide hydrolase N-terminal domain-containing protein [Nonomuraea turcica]|uniref:epoxide hydrolase N-terminal domain-containing protein n=1 Tax=Nonomuraea sp. G32 TaxID=3067274 RepID=UPI00273B9855|nr:epoxide hydrolase N-terminal domain-containing protein [Nonomuraea sp. G32]MDP4511198.1 epoxide hydrolase N-terminal domain-containing protein [Nonomuraea sp. G32]
MDAFVIDIPQPSWTISLRAWAGRARGSGVVVRVPPQAVRELADYWLHAYAWREHEARLNVLPEYTTEIDGQRVHFAHVRSAREDALPLLLTHGWSGRRSPGAP